MLLFEDYEVKFLRVDPYAPPPMPPRVGELEKRGVYHDTAVRAGCSRKGPWRMSRVKWVMAACTVALAYHF